MVASPALPFLLKNKQRERGLTRDLSLFLEVLALHLQVGLELQGAWAAALSDVDCKDLEGGRPLEVLERLKTQWSVKAHRIWFGLIAELYANGSSLVPTVRAFAAVLHSELQRDLDHHCRTLPTKANMWVMVFFLPPALGLVIFPLLWALEV